MRQQSSTAPYDSTRTRKCALPRPVLRFELIRLSSRERLMGRARLRELRVRKLLLQQTTPAALARTAVEELARCGIGRSLVVRLSQDKKALVTLAALGRDVLPEKGDRIRIEASSDSVLASLVARAMDRRNSSEAVVEAAKTWPSILGSPPLADWIWAPIGGDGDLYGLFLADPDSGSTRFSPEDATLLRRITFVLREHIELLESIDEAQQKTLAHHALLELDERLASELAHFHSPNQSRIDQLLQVLADEVLRLTDASVCEIALERNGRFVPVAEAGILTGVPEVAAAAEPSADNSITIQAIVTGTTVTKLGRRQDDFFTRLLSNAERQGKAESLLRVRAWGAYPIRSATETRGALSVASECWDFFSPTVDHVLKAVATRASLVITAQDAMTRIRNELEDKNEKLTRRTYDIQAAVGRVSYAEAARSLLHNIGALVMSMDRDARSLVKWMTRERSKGTKVPSATLERIQGKLQDLESVLESYQALRSGSSDPTPVEINDLVVQAMEFCRYKATERGVSLSVRRDDSEPSVHCASSELLQAFVNVVINAIESFDGSRVGSKRVHVRVFSDENHVTVRIEDNGSGMRQQDIPRAFDLDFSTKLDKGGTGIGLTYVERTIHNCGGLRPHIDSKWGKGTTVSIVLPVWKAGVR